MKNICLVFCLISSLLLSAQRIELDSLTSQLEQLMNIPEEIIHVHLNKNIFLNEEDIGFTAYIIDERTQKPFSDVRNIYAQLVDSKNKITKSQLILADEGVATGIFEIDSLVPPGDYNLKVYTNWLRNFKNPNIGQVPLRIVGDKKDFNSLYQEERIFKVQILPEAGNPINKVFTRAGIIVKDQYGKGERGIVQIKNGDEIKETIELDKNGIGSFVWLPLIDEKLTAHIAIGDWNKEIELPKIESSGFQLSAAVNINNVGVSVETNDTTFEDYAYDEFNLFINGRKSLATYNLELLDLKRSFTVPLDSLEPGMNQITLIHESGQTISKRTFFNHLNFKFISDVKLSAVSDLDSVRLKLNLKQKNAILSVSVLPNKSVAIPKGHSTLKSHHFKPYIYGDAQNLTDYFPLVSLDRIKALDNMLICQGWEVYDLSSLTTLIKKKNKFAFEQGITVEGNINSRGLRELLLYGKRKTSITIIPIDLNSNTFIATGLYPLDGEALVVSGINKRGKAKKVGMVAQFTPRIIPEIDGDSLLTVSLPKDNDGGEFDFQPFESLDETLDVVVVKADPREERNRQIFNKARGRVQFFTDNDRLRFADMGQFLTQNGFVVSRNAGLLDVRHPNENRFQDPVPAFEIDGILFNGPDALIGFNMTIVDYIEIDLSGRNRAFGRQNIPLVRIVTDPSLSPLGNKSRTVSTFEIPLTFTQPKDFYRPSYYSYTAPMYQKLGVIDWTGRLEIKDGSGEISFPFLGLSNIKVLIEGMTPEGTPIHLVKDIIIR